YLALIYRLLYWHRCHRDPDSCPTRRSSDLERAHARISDATERSTARTLLARRGSPNIVSNDSNSFRTSSSLGWWSGRPCCWGNVDRKSTRLNSSHVKISYAVYCLKIKIDQK